MRTAASYVAAETDGQRLGNVMVESEVSGRHWIALACSTVGLYQRSRAGLNLQRNKRLASVRDMCSCATVHMDLALTTILATFGVERRPVSCHS